MKFLFHFLPVVAGEGIVVDFVVFMDIAAVVDIVTFSPTPSIWQMGVPGQDYKLWIRRPHADTFAFIVVGYCTPQYGRICIRTSCILVLLSKRYKIIAESFRKEPSTIICLFFLLQCPALFRLGCLMSCAVCCKCKKFSLILLALLDHLGP